MAGDSQTHIIRNMQLRLQIPGMDKAFALQQRAKKCMEENWNGKLDAILDKYAGNGEYLYIPFLKIELEKLPEEDFEEHFKLALLAALDEALKELVQQDIAVKAGAVPPQESAGSISLKMSKDERTLGAWFYFLEKGILPWWMQHDEQSVLEEQLLAIIRHSPVMFREYWYRAWNHRTINVPRWQLQCSPALRQLMLEVLCPASILEQFRTWLQMLEKMAAPEWAAFQLPLKSLRYTSWHCFFLFIDTGAQYKGAALERFIALQLEHFSKEWERYANTVLPEEVRQQMEEVGKQFLRQSAGAGTSSVEVAPKAPSPEAAGDVLQVKGVSAVERPKEAMLPIHFPELPAEGICVNGAGLVLLHPFLTHLFRHLSWLGEKDHQLKDPFINRAIHLLQFLCTGNEQSPEYDMVMAKVLCGVPLETAIERDIVLDASEKQQAESLLQAVLEHWPPLNSSSVDALRETFLQREGLLQFKNEEWVLQVEQKTVDVLLNKLPWGTSIIRLPWMKHLLKVNWAI
ncbi:contractile injection system tape measure protein [uncultured Chitinophaga sp.]|uniref:contractile injection system tape measure protein n=1 Tax=uncultured Chitinophaga sp. TaxID=339340 RepID=UPI0025DC6C13|nr:contractile injection system tape measure protein [uncultured Chitinophaga sp.]